MSNTEWVILGIILAGLAALFLQHYEITHLDTELAQSKATVESLTAANLSFVKQTNDQNAAISSLQAQITIEETKSATALAQAQKASVRYSSAENAVDAIKPTKNDCKDTFKVIDVYYRSKP